MLGVVDITGKEEAVAVHTLALVQAAVAAATAQLRVERLQLGGTRPARRGTSARTPRPSLYQDSLQVLGTDTADLCVDGIRLQLSQRHSELMTLLALHPRGLTAEELAVLAYPEEASVGSVRAEMLRLRKLLARLSSARIVPESRPYRLPADLVLDAGPTVGAPDTGPRRPLRAVLDVAEELRARPDLAGIGIGVLHGRLAPEEKDRAFAAFASGEAPVLVSTTVVEVGVDVPDATVMVVLDADRFGLSQLHQLRGRVGRGARPGLCLLVSAAQPGTDAHTRLETLAATTDGFELAALDLELRHEGDVLGAAQHGSGSSLRLLRVTRDADVIARARTDARALVEQDGDLATWPALRGAIEASLAGEREEFLERA